MSKKPQFLKSDEEKSTPDVIDADAPPGKPNRAATKRLSLRNKLWPDAADLVWNRKKSTGFTTVPRLLPLVLALIKRLSTKGDPSSVYLDLWFRAFDEGMISITDEAALAFSSGYLGTRAERTWREHMFMLQELGFIKTAAAGNREFAHVLIPNPIHVVCKLQQDNPVRVTMEWWNAFIFRADEIGAQLPEQKVKSPQE